MLSSCNLGLPWCCPTGGGRDLGRSPAAPRGDCDAMHPKTASRPSIRKHDAGLGGRRHGINVQMCVLACSCVPPPVQALPLTAHSKADLMQGNVRLMDHRPPPRQPPYPVTPFRRSPCQPPAFLEVETVAVHTRHTLTLAYMVQNDASPSNGIPWDGRGALLPTPRKTSRPSRGRPTSAALSKIGPPSFPLACLGNPPGHRGEGDLCESSCRIAGCHWKGGSP